MDIDKSGKLTVDEMYEGLKNAGCGMKKSEVEDIIKSVDKDGDKSLTFQEFITLMRLIEQWREAFDEMDVDKSGKLTVDEMYQGLLKSGCELSKDRIVDIVKSADDDGDRSLTFKEFSTLMRL
ncbi:unnamed protein product [Hymenolepis diminuta]|uniref:EF-hand domain-containing protein n=1 Tax=Hymenolepis diminuta TaxID=6216 RepID=A0A0R3SJD4_HYMDI|nr:unnamed protein product [Hymenolepis diminuta]